MEAARLQRRERNGLRMQTQTLIQKAQKGDVQAMTELFDANKSTVWFLCRELLRNEEEAGRAAIYVFNRAVEEVAEGRIAGEAEFSAFTVQKAAAYCKNKVYRQNKRAFRTPENCNFIHNYDAGSMQFCGEPYEVILSNLPVFQRFLYVIHTVAGYSEDELAGLFHIKPKIISKALGDEAANVSRIVSLAEKHKGAGMSMDAESFHETVAREASECQVPENVGEAVKEVIRKACLPLQKKQKKKIWIAAAVCAGTLALCAAAAGLISEGIKTSGVGDETPAGGGAETENGSEGTESSGATEGGETTESDGTTDGSESTGDSETTEDSGSTEDSEATERGTETAASFGAAEEVSIEATHYADIDIEGYGTITVALDGNTAPETVENFVSLAESGFYDGLTFHRIMEGFMMQGGDPNGDGTGGSEDTITGEFSDNGIENNLSHTRGAVAMARSSDYDSASSQFYIVQEDCTSLDGQYAVFGYVTEGMEIVDEICESGEPTDDNGTIPAEEQPVIASITVTAAEDGTEGGNSAGTEQEG